MRTWEKNVRTVVPYTPGEQPKFVDVIKLNTNENPYPPSPKVKECLEKMNTEAFRLYPEPACDTLVDARWQKPITWIGTRFSWEWVPMMFWRCAF